MNKIHWKLLLLLAAAIRILPSLIEMMIAQTILQNGIIVFALANVMPSTIVGRALYLCFLATLT